MNNEEMIGDLRRRYQNTFVFLRQEKTKEEQLMFVNRILYSGSKIGVLELTSPSTGVVTLNLGSEGRTIRFRYPPVGVFQHGRDALSFRRLPQRQYTRGICSSNSSLATVPHMFAGNNAHWDHEEIESAFKHETHTMDDALQMLKTGKARSVALVDNFAISKSLFKTPEHVIWKWHHPVARCTEEGKITNVYCDVFKQRLEQGL